MITPTVREPTSLLICGTSFLERFPAPRSSVLPLYFTQPRPPLYDIDLTLSPFIEKSGKPVLTSTRGLQTLAQTAWKSFCASYQAESARCHSGLFSVWLLCLPLCYLLSSPSSPSPLPSQWACSFVPVVSFIQKNHQSVSESNITLHWLMAGPRGCCDSYSGFVSLRSEACLK